MAYVVEVDGSTIRLTGRARSTDAFWFSGRLDEMVVQRGWPSIDIDARDLNAAFSDFMVPVIASVRRKKQDGVDFRLRLPAQEALHHVFLNANWAHLIDEREHEPSSGGGRLHQPAVKFRNSDEQHEAVDSVLGMLLEALELPREAMKAVEWSLNEVTDNVLNHADSAAGGVLQAQVREDRQSVFFCVADGGIGVSKSLGLPTDRDALLSAIKEGVTRNKTTNQGNGLFGTYQIATMSGGSFFLASGREAIEAHDPNQNQFVGVKAPYFGTFLACEVRCDDPNILERALRFNGRAHDPGYDYIEKAYETDEGVLRLSMAGETAAFGSRQAAAPIAQKIRNLLRADPGTVLVIDFDGAGLLSSSFADEVFGKLFLELGPMNFARRLRLEGVDSTNSRLIDRAILQRSTDA